MFGHSSVFIVFLCVAVVTVSSQDCQRLLSPLQDVGATVSPVTYNGIEPSIPPCEASPTSLDCRAEEGLLSDGDIGPTDSVDVSDPDQVTRFFVWHRDNGSVGLAFTAFDVSSVSYIDVYFLSLPSASIRPPETSVITTNINPRVEATVTPESCSFSSTSNTLTRNTYTISPNPDNLIMTFNFNQETDWMFISEILLCEGDPPSCDSPTTDPTPATSPPPSPTPPSLSLSSPPPTGLPVSPDLSQPHSVTLTCSAASPPARGYQYQWQWRRNGTLLNNTHTRFSITPSTNTQSSSLVISGLRYSDAGDYTCTVEYGACPDGVECSGTTPVTGNIHLDLPLIVEVESSGLVVREGSEVIVLTCEVYGYPRDSSPPMWSSPRRNLESGRFKTTPRYTGQLSNGSVSSSDKVALSQLTIFNVTVADEGEYTCSVDGESASFHVDLGGGSKSSGSNSGVIAGVLITLLLLIALIIILIVIFWMVWHYRRRGKLDLGSCRELSCGSCSCVPLLAALRGVKLPTRHRENLNKNGTRLNERNHIADTNTEIYSVVQKPLKKIGTSPPPLPPLTLTETELNELMSVDEKEELSPIHEKPTRRNTGLSTYSQSGTVPKLAKLTKLRKFKMKENPIYQSADELELQIDNTLYALPSKTSSTRNSASFTDDLVSDPIYSVAINPSMFTKRSSTIGNDDDLHPYGPIYARPIKQKMGQPLNVSVDNIREVKQIGVGQFGAVVLAEMTGLSRSDVASLPKGSVNADGVALVAMKKLKPDVSDEVRQSFDKEIKFMSQLQHDSIVQLLAVCTHSKHPFIVMEYMENGDLNQFLQKYQMVDDDSALYSNQIPPSTLLYMAVQIASGMVYLSSLNYVHRDLATRNCLVGSNFRIKISDFGMSRNLYERVYYRVRGRAMLPIRWMATESFYGRFSEKSDAWAYGVTVWEIYTLGKKQPYEELDDQDMIQDAIRGTGRRVMGRPEGCPQAVYEVLLRCWEYAAADRATFKEIHDSLNLIQLNS